MTTLTVYLFDSESKNYSGTWECQESPLEQGAFIQPVHSTTEVVPTFNPELEKCIWNGMAWNVETIPVEIVEDPEPIITPAPTKEELLAQLQALQAQIESLA